MDNNLANMQLEINLNSCETDEINEHLHDFSSIYEDLEPGIERDARRIVISTISWQDLNNTRDLNNRIILSQPKKSQTEIPERSCDKRQGNVDLSHARRGLKAEDPLPDG
ncbi:689_t:CDS:2, partial [Racocetra persica]